MISTPIAAHTPRTPQSLARRGDQHGGAGDEGDDHRGGDVRAVARADQDPVEGEDGAVQRLHEREDGPEERALREDGRVVGEDARKDVGERQETEGEDGSDDDRERDHPDARVERTLRASCAELPADDDLTGDRDRVEHEREEDPELERDLVGAELRIAEARDDGTGEQERADERRGADEEELADREQPPRRARAPARGRRDRRAERSARRTPTPMHVCATAVPQAEPSIPQSKP